MKRSGKAVVWIVVVAVLFLIAGFVVFSFTGKAKDLGVRYTSKDFQNVSKKAGVIKDAIPVSGKRSDYTYNWSGKVNVNAVYSQEELTAWFDSNRPSYSPFKNVQIKINNDGTVEASANVDFKSIADYYLTPEERKYVPSFIPSAAPMYAKGTLSVTNNVVHLNPEKITIGLVPVPSNLLTPTNVSYLETKIESLIAETPNLYVETLKVQDGKIVYKGTGPKTLTRVKKP
ncbi:MAG: hypothetical protein ACP5SB_01495 [Caldisericaceae bacterium]